MENKEPNTYENYVLKRLCTLEEANQKLIAENKKIMAERDKYLEIIKIFYKRYQPKAVIGVCGFKSIDLQNNYFYEEDFEEDYNELKEFFDLKEEEK